MGLQFRKDRISIFHNNVVQEYMKLLFTTLNIFKLFNILKNNLDNIINLSFLGFFLKSLHQMQIYKAKNL